MFPGTFAATAPDRPAVVVAETGETMTYAELDAESARLARHLHGQGLRRGDVLAMLADNSPWAFVVYWAAQRSGLYVTAVNHHLSPDEAGYIVDDCGARAIVVSGRTPALAALARDLVERTPRVTHRLAFGGSVAGYEDYATTLADVPAEPLADQPRGADMLYSSGTTGRPKGIKPALPQRQVTEAGDLYVAVFAPMYGFGEDTVYLSPAPVYHAAPLRFGSVVHATGGTVVMMTPTPRPRSPRSSAPGSPTASGCRPCSCACSRSPPRSAPPTTCPPCAWRCTPRRRARWTSSGR